MTPTTRSMPSQAEVLEHLVSSILNLKDTDPVYKALSFSSYLDDLFAFLSLDEDSIPKLRYEEIKTGAQGKRFAETKELTPGHCRLLVLLLRWIYHLEQKKGDSLSQADLKGTSKDDFDQFRISRPPPVPKSSLNMPNSSSSIINDFKRGIKRDASVYPILKDDKNFDQFNMVLISQARAHGIEEVFDSQYSPKTDEEHQLFQEKQKFAYSVLIRCVQTDIGRTIVREHKDDFDAQVVYAELSDYYQKSTSAELAISELQDTLTNAKITNNWRGTAHGFLLYWKEHMRKLEELLPPTAQFDPSLKKIMLKNAVSGLPALATVFEIDANNVSIGNQPLSYESYFGLLQSAAVSRRKVIH